MAPVLARVKASVKSTQLCELLEQHGAVVVENLISPKQLTELNAELDQHLQERSPGIRHPTHPSMVEFYGDKTIRFDGLPGKSSTFVDLMLLPKLLNTADHFLLPSCGDYLLNTGQLIQINPGESDQLLHRDEDAWSELPTPKPTLQIEAMFALTDFTVANGATRVVPGSHKWPLDRKPEPNEITHAEMPAGSALIYLGSAIHGGSANTTTNEDRRGMFLGYVVGWLRTEENSFLTVPIEKVRAMPRRVQELLGYKAHRSIGVVDVGDPMQLLK
jgi:ectoine hydroxylase-related dioxygenase (phytanoyl-CoA dioxygenase family)